MEKQIARNRMHRKMERTTFSTTHKDVRRMDKKTAAQMEKGRDEVFKRKETKEEEKNKGRKTE